MDWKKLITDLEASGLTQIEIAEKCGCSQPYISQLKAGIRGSPVFELGSALSNLHKLHCCPASRDSAA